MLFLLLVRSEYWLRLKMLCLGSDLKIRSIAHRARHLRPGRQADRPSFIVNEPPRQRGCMPFDVFRYTESYNRSGYSACEKVSIAAPAFKSEY